MPLWKEISKPSSLPDQISASQDNLPVNIKIANLSLIQSYKMAKYIFPRNDPGPSQAGLQEISFLRSLEYAINVAQHRLTPELKTVWDNLCTRDVQEPEISAVGIQSTKYDLKQRSDIFKKHPLLLENESN